MTGPLRQCGAHMQDERVLEILEELCRRLLITVQYETLENEELRIEGGGCIVRGEHRIIMDRSMPPSHRIRILARELGLHDLGHIYLPPFVRELIEREGEARLDGQEP